MDKEKLLALLRSAVKVLEAGGVPAEDTDPAGTEAPDAVETGKVEAVDEAEAQTEPAAEPEAPVEPEAEAEAPAVDAEPEEAQAVEPEVPAESVEDACKDEAILSEDELEDFGKHDDLDLDDPRLQRAFAYGVRYGESKEKEEPKKLDSEHESEGMKKALGEDSAGNLHAIAEQVYALNKKQFADIHAAAEATRGVLGRIQVMAYDSASQVYMEACKRLKLKCTEATARDVFNAYGAVKKTMAQDSAAKTPKESGVLGSLLGRVKIN